MFLAFNRLRVEDWSQLLSVDVLNDWLEGLKSFQTHPEEKSQASYFKESHEDKTAFIKLDRDDLPIVALNVEFGKGIKGEYQENILDDSKEW